MMSYLLVLHLLIPLVLLIISCLVHLFQLFLLMFTRINFRMELLVRIQTTISFVMTMCGSLSLNKNMWWILIFLILCNSLIAQNFYMILSFLLNLAKNLFLIMLFPITLRIHGMLVFHPNSKRNFFSWSLKSIISSLSKNRGIHFLFSIFPSLWFFRSWGCICFWSGTF